MKHYDKLSDKEKEEYRKLVTFQLATGDVAGILELLSWTKTTAAYLASLEHTKGTPKAEIKLSAYSKLADNLIQFITSNVLIGEPDYEKIN